MLLDIVLRTPKHTIAEGCGRHENVVEHRSIALSEPYSDDPSICGAHAADQRPSPPSTWVFSPFGHAEADVEGII